MQSDLRSSHANKSDNVQNLSHFQDYRLPLNWGRIEAMSEDDGLKAMGQVIQIDEARIRDHLGEMVRGTVEEMRAVLERVRETFSMSETTKDP
jgi:hypothetical protein